MCTNTVAWVARSVCVYVCMYVCMYVYVCVYKHSNTGISVHIQILNMYVYIYICNEELDCSCIH